MADFKINSQYGQIIQQADSITNQSRLIHGSSPEYDLPGKVRPLLADIESLVESGELTAQTGAEIYAAIEEATAAKDRRSMLSALHRAGEVAAGITVLGGVAEAINNIIGLVTGGS